MNVVPWLLTAVFALMWWRRGRAGSPHQSPPPASRPETAAVTETAPPVFTVPPTSPPHITIVKAAPASPRAAEASEDSDLADSEPGKAHLRGRQNWIWAGSGLLAVALGVILLSAAYNRIPVTPDPRGQTQLGIAADGPSTLTALAGADPSRAPALFHSYGCVSCHVIPGVSGASGRVGPNLAHLYDHALIAGVLPNTPENLLIWIRVPQNVDPRTGMPNLGVTAQDARDLAAYLQTLP
ncbi:c-type cytochrome [Deinococcus humi]|uniref:Cytochrome c1 n=1 Tax=Deinococcus humi TaxID=662880 RepID=A0A7W8JWX8_9DEIO|nr:cytochrome c [Deinococcus humi]MBB5363438.1 cytochrome c1 [Deinococcus humi]GGO26527.1 hypothetical protein GCM10008949_17350 [Deinococcus humi]